MFSMGDGGEDARSRDVTGGDSARGEAARREPTGTHGEPVAVEHAKGSNRIPTIPPEDEVLEKFNAKIPLGRYSTPEEVAGLVTYLTTDTASSITAQALNVCGGLGNY